MRGTLNDQQVDPSKWIADYSMPHDRKFVSILRDDSPQVGQMHKVPVYICTVIIRDRACVVSKSYREADLIPEIESVTRLDRHITLTIFGTKLPCSLYCCPECSLRRYQLSLKRFSLPNRCLFCLSLYAMWYAIESEQFKAEITLIYSSPPSMNICSVDTEIKT